MNPIGNAHKLVVDIGWWFMINEWLVVHLLLVVNECSPLMAEIGWWFMMSG